ncbi:MAG: hypothetical protein ACLPYS_13255 [Vulcanimicrobiaceae bacterium]
MKVVLFIHASPVSLAATLEALERHPDAPALRHALATDLVDPRAMHFAHDDAGYERLRSAVLAHLHDDVGRVVLSCSIYNGFAPRLEAELGLPVERSDEAGAHAVLALGPRIGLAVSYPPSYPVIEAHLLELAALRNTPVELTPLLRENAFAFADDAERYGRVLVEAARDACDTHGLDALFLAQFSLDPNAASVAKVVRIPVVSAPEASLHALRGVSGA